MVKWLGDPGHGGQDAGAVYNGRFEKADVLDIAKRVQTIMIENGETFELTRSTDIDVPLKTRTDKENSKNYDYFISFHRNDALDKNGNHIGTGVETYSLSTTGKGRKLAEKMQEELKKYFKDRGVKTANFYVLRKTKAPAILIELGFMGSLNDNNTFTNKIDDISFSIAKVLLAFVGKTIKPQKKGFYRVIANSYENKENALKQQQVLKSLGISSFLEYKE